MKDLWFELKRDAMMKEITEAEAEANAPVAMPDPDAHEVDIKKIIDDKLVAKMRVYDMKVDHGLLFGRCSPYFGMTW